jgi:plastocyanin
MRSLRIAAAGAVAAIAVAACSSNDSNTASAPADNLPAATTDSGAYSSPATTPPATTDNGGGGGQAAATGTITIQDFQYGEPLAVAPGATITVTNKDSAPHDVVADDGSFKTETLDQNQSATFKAPAKAGTYKFSCSLHANMTSIGTLVVQG